MAAVQILSCSRAESMSDGFLLPADATLTSHAAASGLPVHTDRARDAHYLHPTLSLLFCRPSGKCENGPRDPLCTGAALVCGKLCRDLSPPACLETKDRFRAFGDKGGAAETRALSTVGKARSSLSSSSVYFQVLLYWGLPFSPALRIPA